MINALKINILFTLALFVLFTQVRVRYHYWSLAADRRLDAFLPSWPMQVITLHLILVELKVLRKLVRIPASNYVYKCTYTLGSICRHQTEFGVMRSAFVAKYYKMYSMLRWVLQVEFYKQWFVIQNLTMNFDNGLISPNTLTQQKHYIPSTRNC